ncbi:hypothetical protein CPB84DRAFT_1870809 [Gymnopilus junonius]|uniref:Histone-lysine N-methyltransferase n=1 Tax=Gymnopilus junonius TaxID=109634 RepID=A0A9P5NY20_GYMJU|nr:hypothetical protein CPB84DRAFT_1870809 [Gymnopilus junonius]
MEYSTTEPLPQAELSGASDGEAGAGPSNGLRRSSQRSSRSSSSVQSLGAFTDDDNAVSASSVPVSRNTTPEESINLAEGSSPIKHKTYGGFQALTWKEYRKDLNNFTPKCKYGRDLPHSFQDHINQMSLHTRMMPDMRVVFEAMIRENTAEDEPDAPAITLENEVDNEPTPLWEFHYTNEMWHGEGVPPPDIKSLVSCNCKGGCNPKSKTCACLKRQKEVTGDPTMEFAYDKNGRLKIPGFPVFECNDLCGCGPECQNRVVQHGRKVQVMIKKTEHKGWGVFAGGRKIPSHTFIGIYSGELLTDSEAHDRGVNYNKAGRTYLFDLDFHHQKTGPNWANQYTVDAYHAGNFTRFLNHSCDPNVRLYPCYINEGNIQKPLLVVFSRRDIEPGEEICFSYSGNGDVEGDDKEGKRDKVYGACKCGAKNCTGIIFRPPPSLGQE